MTRVAIFVEGQTERTFVRRLLYQRYASETAIVVQEMVLKGKKRYFQPSVVSQIQGINYSFLIIEVPDYSQVISMVRHNAENMIREGFSFVIGLRDLHPNGRNEKANVTNVISALFKELTVRDKTGIVLAVMETEAWFLYDWQLFQRINNILCPNFIQTRLNYDLVNNDPELYYEHPSKSIDNILKLVRLRYRKRIIEIDTIVDNIDFNNLFSCTSKIDSFLRFVNLLDLCGLPARPGNQNG